MAKNIKTVITVANKIDLNLSKLGLFSHKASLSFNHRSSRSKIRKMSILQIFSNKPIAKFKMAWLPAQSWSTVLLASPALQQSSSPTSWNSMISHMNRRFTRLNLYAPLSTRTPASNANSLNTVASWAQPDFTLPSPPSASHRTLLCDWGNTLCREKSNPGSNLRSE